MGLAFAPRGPSCDSKPTRVAGEPTYIVQTVFLVLLYHLDTFTHLAALLDHAICNEKGPSEQARPGAFHAHLNSLAQQFPHYPCSSPDNHRRLHLLRHPYAAHAAYLRPPILSWAEAWSFASLLLSWVQTAALLLLPRARRSATWQLLWLGGCVLAELLLPSASLLLLGTPPPSFLYHYPPVMLEVLLYSALLGLPSSFLLFTGAASWASLSLVTYGLARHGLASAVPYSLPLLWAQLAAVCVLVAAFVAVRSRLWAALLRLLTPGAPATVRAASAADAAAAPSPLVALGGSSNGSSSGSGAGDGMTGPGREGGCAGTWVALGVGLDDGEVEGWVAQEKHAASGGFGAFVPRGALPALPPRGTAAAVTTAIAEEVKSKQRACSESQWLSGRGEGQGALGSRGYGGSASQPFAPLRGKAVAWQWWAREDGLYRRRCTEAAAEVVAGGQGQDPGLQVASQQQRHAAPQLEQQQQQQQQHGWRWVVRLLEGQAAAWGWGGGAGQRRVWVVAGAGGGQRCGRGHSGGGCGGDLGAEGRAADGDTGRLCRASGPHEGLVGTATGGPAGDGPAASVPPRAGCTGTGAHRPGDPLQGQQQQRQQRPGRLVSGGVGHTVHVPGCPHGVPGLTACSATQHTYEVHGGGMSWPQQQGQQQQEQARTAELVKRVQRFIRQTRNAPYRSDTSVVRVAVRLPGLRPQDVYGNGVTGAAWLAEQLAGRLARPWAVLSAAVVERPDGDGGGR